MKTDIPIQEDWLAPQSDAASDLTAKQQMARGYTLPLYTEEISVAKRVPETTARHRLQRQLGRPQSNNNLAAARRSRRSNTANGEQEKVAEHLSSAMELAESLNGRSPRQSYRQRKTTGVLICRHLVAALKLEVAEADHI